MVRRDVMSWAFYDWANSAFATTVMAGFFPVFFKEYWSAGADATVSTFRLGWANSTASIIVALLAPFLGAVADRGGFRKRFLLGFTLLGVLATGALWTVPAGAWGAAALLYAAASVGFAGGVLFNDSLIVAVSDGNTVDRVSSLGYAMGYLGGGLLLALNVWMVRSPGSFGLASPGEAVRLSFLTVSLWWAVFSIPLFLAVREPAALPGSGGALRDGLRRLLATLREVRRLRNVALFLAGYWVYIDGVDTIVRMAVDYGLSIGFPAGTLVLALLLTQFVGFPSAIAFGRIAERLGARTGIFICLSVYLGVTAWAFFMNTPGEFFVLAITIGLVQGGVQALSRSFYARLIPPGRSAEFFGFYNVMGKTAAVIGPVMMGWVGVLTGSPRLSILSIALLFLIGGGLLSLVDGRTGADQGLAN